MADRVEYDGIRPFGHSMSAAGKSMDEYCTKRTRIVCKWALCSIPWLTLLMVFAYFILHYDVLTRSNSKCNATLHERNMSEAALRITLADVEHKNDQLKDSLKKMQLKLDHKQSQLQAVQDKLDIYLGVISDLKQQLNLKISADALTNGALNLNAVSLHVISILIVLFLYLT